MLARHAPGSATTEVWLLIVAELGRPCPPGARGGWTSVPAGRDRHATSLVLAAETGGTVLAVDTHPPFLRPAARRPPRRSGSADRVAPIRASMTELPLPDGSIDLVWAEGSAYVMGFDAGAGSWRRLLAADGALVLTEAEWTTLTRRRTRPAFWEPATRPCAAPTATSRAALGRRAGRVQATLPAAGLRLGGLLRPAGRSGWTQLRARGRRPRGARRGRRRRSGSGAGTGPTTATPATCCARAETAPPENVGAAH